jgi:hypothetical protein
MSTNTEIYDLLVASQVRLREAFRKNLRELLSHSNNNATGGPSLNLGIEKQLREEYERNSNELQKRIDEEAKRINRV